MSDQLSVSNPSQQVSVLVVDDADVIRKALRGFLKEEPAIKLLCEASNFAEAISMTAALKPDVVLLDVHMPDDRAFHPEFVKASLCRARVLAMSLPSDYKSDEETRLLAENFGAVRMLDKTKLCDELIPEILQMENLPQSSGHISQVGSLVRGLVAAIRAFKFLAAFWKIRLFWKEIILHSVFYLKLCKLLVAVRASKNPCCHSVTSLLSTMRR